MQAVSPAPQAEAQLPWEHTCPRGQALLHAPQWARSLRVCTQRRRPSTAQRVPLTHSGTQSPARQVSPRAHTLPQAPQFRGSPARVRQASPQAVKPSPQVTSGTRAKPPNPPSVRVLLTVSALSWQALSATAAKSAAGAQCLVPIAVCLHSAQRRVTDKSATAFGHWSKTAVAQRDRTLAAVPRTCYPSGPEGRHRPG